MGMVALLQCIYIFICIIVFQKSYLTYYQEFFLITLANNLITPSLYFVESKEVDILFANAARTQKQYHIAISNRPIDWSHRDFFTPQKTV